MGIFDGSTLATLNTENRRVSVTKTSPGGTTTAAQPGYMVGSIFTELLETIDSLKNRITSLEKSVALLQKDNTLLKQEARRSIQEPD